MNSSDGALLLTSFGASVRGPLHEELGKPNEDAWLHAKNSTGRLIVISDGMGSRPNSRIGSRAACIAVQRAVREWTRKPGASPKYLVHLVEALWRLEIHPEKPETAACTCLLAHASVSGVWTLAAIGDGTIIIRTGNKLDWVYEDSSTGFSNETEALGLSSRLDSWTIKELPPTGLDRTGLLATDGISEDIRPGTRAQLVDFMIQNYMPLDPNHRWRKLSRDLRAWPTPRHLDDKTMAVIHSPQGNIGGK